MKATIVMGSPRGKKGASSRVARQFSTGLRRAGADTTEILLKEHKINHCIGCFTCWTKTPGRCIHRDDMDNLLPHWQTDLLVWATPLYYFSMPGIVKDVVDRQLPLIEPLLINSKGTTSHPRRGNTSWPATFLISVAGFPERSHFDTLVANFKKFSPNYIGDILIGGAEPMSRNELQGAYADLYQLVEHAGFEVGSTGRVTGKTEQALLERTTFSPEKIEELRTMANTYWQSQIAEAPAPKTDTASVSDRVLKISDGGMAAFLASMAMNYSPAAIPGFSGTIQFRFETENYHLIIEDEVCRAYAGEYPAPALTIITPRQVWMDISDGTLNGTKAYMDGQYKIQGDLNLLMKLNQLFGTETAGDQGPQKEMGQPSLKDDKIPEHRGPIHLPAMTWLAVAFLPWMILWTWGAVTPGPVPYFAAAGIAVLIAAYHLTTNVITLFEAGTAVYLIGSTVLQISGWAFFARFGPVADYVFLGGLWLVSLARRFSLTAEYSRYQFPKSIWNTQSFIQTNAVICAAWGIYFLVAALLRLIMNAGAGPKAGLTLLIYILLVPMVIFTDKFQKWYPEQLMRAKPKSGRS
jgi:multimeric flavodoxin WrbA/putative sterol carrier protein